MRTARGGKGGLGGKGEGYFERFFYINLSIVDQYLLVEHWNLICLFHLYPDFRHEAKQPLLVTLSVYPLFQLAP